MTELTLKRGVAQQVSPAGAFTAIQNSMTTTDDMLMFSTSGKLDDKWMELVPGGSVKFSEPLFFLQKSWDTFVFPVVEGS